MSCNIYILAGGKSSRMGSEKGLVLLNHKPMILHVIEEAKKVSQQVFILTNCAAFQSFGLPLIPDEIPELGPAGAIATLLSHTTELKNVVLACDMPFVDADSIRLLLKSSEGFDIAVPTFQSYLEAMPGIYSSECKNKWHEAIRNNQRKLSEIISLYAVNFVSGEEMVIRNEKLFRNINSKNDLNV